MQVLKLNRPAISAKLSVKELSVKPYVNTLSYMDNSRIIRQASLETPVYRLMKDYEVDGAHFALNLIITANDAGHVEKFMDSIASQVTKDQAQQHKRPFEYLDETYKPKKGKK